ncbi:Arginase/deacetylase [Ramaria rubella]|nr:Arginase/deacetylase [Ramaria rubella]
MSSAPHHSEPQTTVFFQDTCLLHRYIRSSDTSLIFERPQRLRAVKLGVAAAIARLEEQRELEEEREEAQLEDALAGALERLNIAEEGPRKVQDVTGVQVVTSTASVDLLHHPAVEYVHGDKYIAQLDALTQESEAKIAKGESEIPAELSQGDLYLCKQSLDAIRGAIGTVCEAVDRVVEGTAASTGPHRAFVAVRPPGHHCGEDTPAGFCFVNNVAVGAAHAHLKHGISRVVVLDIDLHHGNGTQSIAWDINAEAHRQLQTQLETENSAELSTLPSSPPLQIYYGSLHDPMSYPCEDGSPAFTIAASVSIHGPHGQHIENVHLRPWTSDEDFWGRLYGGVYGRLLQRAKEFLEGGEGKAMVFISAGFDASSHETPSMSRHGRSLPTSFYARFTRDTCALAEHHGSGVVSVLEGGYSDRALCSGVMAHLVGMAAKKGLVETNKDVSKQEEEWWAVDNLMKIEKAAKKPRGGCVSGVAGASDTPPEKWVARTLAIFSTFGPDVLSPTSRARAKIIPPSTMTLRERGRKDDGGGGVANASGVSPSPSRTPSSSVVPGPEGGAKDAARAPEEVLATATSAPQVAPAPTKKLPRVFLRVNPPESPGTGSSSNLAQGLNGLGRDQGS